MTNVLSYGEFSSSVKSKDLVEYKLVVKWKNFDPKNEFTFSVGTRKSEALDSYDACVAAALGAQRARREGRKVSGTPAREVLLEEIKWFSGNEKSVEMIANELFG